MTKSLKFYLCLFIYFKSNSSNDSFKFKSNVLRVFVHLKAKSFAENEAKFTEVMQSNAYYPVKKEIIYQIKNVPFETKAQLIRLAMQTNDIEVRQAVAETINPVPNSFKTEYESLFEAAIDPLVSIESYKIPF